MAAVQIVDPRLGNTARTEGLGLRPTTSDYPGRALWHESDHISGAVLRSRRQLPMEQMVRRWPVCV